MPKPTYGELEQIADEAGESEKKLRAELKAAITERQRVEEKLEAAHQHLDERVAQRTAALAVANEALQKEIVERQRAQDELQQEIAERKRIEAALRESERRYRLISENARDVIWTSGINLERTYVSPSVEQLRGFTAEEAVSQSLEEYMTPASIELVHQILAEEQLIESQPDADPKRSRTIEVENLCRDGSTVWVEMTASFLRDEEQRPIGILGISRNISERRRIQEEKAHLEEELRHSQKMEAIGRLAGGVAHDFNNILTAISGYAELIQLALGPNDPLNDDAREIYKAAGRAAKLTTQLLAFSRKNVRAPKVLQLARVISDSEKMLRRIISEDVRMTIRAGADLWPVKTDADQVDQILVNLAVNSRDAMEAGGKLVVETANVTVTDEQARAHGTTVGDFVMLSVKDTGSGMSPETRERMFEPFFTTKPEGQGSGLGLSTVYGLVRQNRGFIEVESEPGVGSTFKVYFPRAAGSVAEKPSDAPVTLSGGTETILLAEDADMVRTLTKRILEKQGYRVMDANTPLAACRLADEHGSEINLLLTDVVMPGMSGRELCTHLQQRRPGLKVLYMSGYAYTEMAQDEIDEAAFLSKPFTVAELLSKVRETLAG